MIKNIKEYKDKKKRLIDLDKYYYDLNTPKVDDSTMIFLKKELIDFEEKNLKITGDNRIKDSVGYKPSENSQR